MIQRNDIVITLSKEQVYIERDWDADEVLLYLLLEKKYTGVCPKCQWTKPFVKTNKKRSFHCTRCGYQIFPCAGTIFEKSLMSLGWWLLIISEHFHNPNVEVNDFMDMWLWEVDGEKYYVGKGAVLRAFRLIKANLHPNFLIVSRQNKTPMPIQKNDIVLHGLSQIYFRCENSKMERWMNMNPYYVKSVLPEGYLL